MKYIWATVGILVIVLLLWLGVAYWFPGFFNAGKDALQPFVDWMAANDEFISKRTGLVEAVGWMVAVIIAIVGIRLAWLRTDALKDSVEETRKSIDLATDAHKHDQELELRKQFRQAASDLDQTNFSKTKHALTEFERISFLNEKEFATIAIHITHGFLNECAPQTAGMLTETDHFSIAAISTMGNILNRMSTRADAADLKRFKTFSGYKFNSGFYNCSLSKISFKNCEFLGRNEGCHFRQTEFTRCTFRLNETSFFNCNLRGSKIVIGRVSSTGKQLVKFDNCNLRNSRVLRVSAQRTSADFSVVSKFIGCNLSSAQISDRIESKFFHCWFKRERPTNFRAKNSRPIQNDKIFDCNGLQPTDCHPIVGPIFDYPEELFDDPDVHSPAPTT